MAMTRIARPAWPRWAAGLAWTLWLLFPLGLAATAWLDRLLRQAGHPQDAYLVAGNLPALVAMVAAVTVGAVLASRRPRHPVGWLLLGLGYGAVVLGLGRLLPNGAAWSWPGPPWRWRRCSSRPAAASSK
jgi:hypothetical protein